MAERIPADMDAFLREHAARATPLPEVRESALARWPHASDATDEQRRTHATRIETAYKHRRKRARGEARAALADSVLSPALEAVAVAPEAASPLADALTNEFTARKRGDDETLKFGRDSGHMFGPGVNLTTDQGLSTSVDCIVSEDPEIQTAPSRQTVKIDSGRTDADSLATPLIVVIGDDGVSVSLATGGGGDIISTTADVNTALAARGVVPGTKVRIVGPNGQEWAWVSESGILPGDRIAPEERPSNTQFEDDIEAAFWHFDDQRKRTGSERDAFKGQVRRLVDAFGAPPRFTINQGAVRRDAFSNLESSPLSREKLQEMVDAFKRAQQVISVRSDIERLEGVVDNLASQVGRLADAVSQMLAQAQDVAAAKDALIDTQRRYIEHLQRMVGA